jgi:PAS domain S-box-containing protein
MPSSSTTPGATGRFEPTSIPSSSEVGQFDALVGGIGAALEANLSRGFLESEDPFRQIAESLHDIVALTDDQMTKLFFVNAAYETVWGRSRESLYKSLISFIDGVHPDDRDRVRDAMVGRAGEGYDVEYRVLRPGGDQRWVWSRGFPVRNPMGQIYRIASITEDITDRVRVIESRERLTRGFTHDVRNPLGAADGNLELLETGVYGQITQAQTEAVGRARRLIRTAIGLVAQLLEIERAEAGQLKIEQVRLNLAALTRETVEGFRFDANAKRLSLVVAGPREGDSVIIESDPARARQILANLVANAVKYTQAGGSIEVLTRVATENEGPRQGYWVAVSVSDNGPGIPFDKQNLLFREFTRFDPGAAEGSGIGLAISQRLARALGGAITFESRAGGGSTFTIWLPRTG